MNNKSIKRAVITGILLSVAFDLAVAQTNALLLEDCYTAAQQNYPLIKQRELLLTSKNYSVENASKGYLPQLNIYGQATYQSEVTTIPISLPGKEIPALTKDQYKIYGELTQLVFDGGNIRQQKKYIEANNVVESQKVEIELYKLKERINQLFFGILIIDEQLKQNDILKKDIASGIKKAQALADNGAALKNSVSILKAELLKADQRSTELNASRKSYLNILALFINRTLDENSVFIKPPATNNSAEIKRPELLLYDYQDKSLNMQSGSILAKSLPKINLFFQGGYGKPALNILKTDFTTYYITGLRFNWNISGFYTSKNEKALIAINHQAVAIQKELFLLNTAFTVKQQDVEQLKLEEFLKTDDEIIVLRTAVKTASMAQLESGVINSNDYLRDVNAEDQARQNKILHEIQLLMVQYNQKITKGN